MRDRALGSTVTLHFETSQADGTNVAPSSAFVAADFQIYKGTSGTPKSTPNGVTVTSPVNGVVGTHSISMDTSNATGDAGFWAVGSSYFVRLNTAKTVDGKSVAGKLVGEFSLELQTAQADLRKILGTTLTETVGGYIAAAFRKVFDVASAVFTAASVNQTGDAFARIGSNGAGLTALGDTRLANLANLDVAISVIQSQITALNNLSAKANWFGSTLLEIPDSGTRAYVFELVIKDDEDKLVNLDSLPTITLTNSAGTDRSSLITTGIANAATGRYTLTITVGTSTTNEALLLKASGTVSGETRYAVLATQVVDYDSGALINTIYTRLGVPSTTIAGDLTSLSNKVGTPAGVSIAADIAAEKAVVDAISNRIPAALVEGRMDVSVGAIANAVITAASIANGALNGKGDWRTALTLLGGLTETQWANLLSAALLGQTSQPSDTTEKFKHLDGSDAFTTTLDSNGNRTNVAIT